LAEALDADEYEIHFACAPEYHPLLTNESFTTWPLRSRPGQEILVALAAGKRMFELETLRRYVHDDLALIGHVRPDVIVGDLRFSLSVSAALARVPFLMICNAYWSPYARQRFCVPEIPLTRQIGPGICNPLFKLARPFAFRHHNLPINRLRREFGLPSLGWDHRRLYTEADHALYVDVPELVPTYERPRNHHYLGPIIWSYPTRLPPWWYDVPTECPVVYVGLGSSGAVERLPQILQTLADMPVTVLVSTVGRQHLPAPPGNVFWADFLPGREASARADLVICHGGSAASYVALAAGKPVLGIPSNMDQHLTMDYIVQAGAGRALRSEYVNPRSLRDLVTTMLVDMDMHARARRMAEIFAAYDARSRFRGLLEALTGRSSDDINPAHMHLKR
jgi:UDP:flavonoid glycosyltransferase YjiC (YdhE family)